MLGVNNLSIFKVIKLLTHDFSQPYFNKHTVDVHISFTSGVIQVDCDHIKTGQVHQGRLSTWMPGIGQKYVITFTWYPNFVLPATKLCSHTIDRYLSHLAYYTQGQLLVFHGITIIYRTIRQTVSNLQRFASCPDTFDNHPAQQVLLPTM